MKRIFEEGMEEKIKRKGEMEMEEKLRESSPSWLFRVECWSLTSDFGQS